MNTKIQAGEKATLSQEYVASNCAVKNVTGELLTLGRVKDITREHLEIEGASERLMLIPYNTIVRFSVVNRELPPFVGTGKVYLSTPQMLRITDYSNALYFEQRSAFRVALNSVGKVRLSHDSSEESEASEALDMSEEAEAEAEELRSFEVRVRNISLSGLLFISEKYLQIGQPLHIIVRLEHMNFEFDCLIRRKEKLERNEWGYGCSFREMPRQLTDKLCAVLFRKQGEQIRRAKEHGK